MRGNAAQNKKDDTMGTAESCGQEGVF